MRKNKKGFTLVELVIVIAVIAILAAVLLPTFAGIINRARVNSATQRATSIRNEFYSEHFESYEQIKGGKIYVLESGKLYTFTIGEGDDASKLVMGETVTATELPTPEAGNQYQEYDNAIVILTEAPTGTVVNPDATLKTAAAADSGETQE